MRGGFKIVKRRRSRIVRSIRFHKDKDPENYYREQLMLYYPWRSGGKDLLGSSLSYQERYKQVEYTSMMQCKLDLNYAKFENVTTFYAELIFSIVFSLFYFLGNFLIAYSQLFSQVFLNILSAKFFHRLFHRFIHRF